MAERSPTHTVDSFEPVVRAVAPRLYRIALRILGRAADAEDAVQDAFVRAYDALSTGKYDDRSQMEAWLVTIVTRSSIDLYRRRKLRAAADEAALDELQAAGLTEDQAHATVDIARWMDDLPPDQRAAVVLKFFEGMTSKEVGDALGVSEGAVEQRILRARATLKRRDEGDG